MAVWWLTLANNMESIMSSKILAGAAALALTTVLVTAGPASAQNWGCYNGCYPNYAYAPLRLRASVQLCAALRQLRRLL